MKRAHVLHAHIIMRGFRCVCVSVFARKDACDILSGIVCALLRGVCACSRNVMFE